MKDSWIFWLLGAVLVFLVLKQKGSTTTGTSGAAGALPNTNTHNEAPQPWLNNAIGDAQTVYGKASTVATEASSTATNLWGALKGLFGGSSTATGAASPTTSGSGAGVVNNSQAGDNSGNGSPADISPGLQSAGFGYDQFSNADFGSGS